MGDQTCDLIQKGKLNFLYQKKLKKILAFINGQIIIFMDFSNGFEQPVNNFSVMLSAALCINIFFRQLYCARVCLLEATDVGNVV